MVLYGLVGIFAFAGGQKLIFLEAFARGIFAYQLLPESIVHIAALWIAGLEVIIAFSLLIPPFRSAGIGLMIALLLLFSIAVSLVLLRGDQVACSCFLLSSTTSQLTGWTLLRNGLLITFAVWIRRYEHI